MDLDLEQIKQCVENTSGFPFELEIARRVERHADSLYWVQPNFSFEDQDSGEARELDFYATKFNPILGRSSPDLFNVILGSCKKNTNPYLFFTRKLPIPGATQCDSPISGYPLEIFKGTESESCNVKGIV